jgi:hypothetical protein
LATVLGCSAAVSPTADNASQPRSLETLTDIAAQRVQLADTVAAAKWEPTPRSTIRCERKPCSTP